MIKRSRAYPALTLKEAIEVLGRIVRALGWVASSRDTIAQALGYANGSTGLAGRTVAALGHYGLLDRKGHIYQPSLLAERVLRSDEWTIRRQALREAFLKPTLFKEIVDSYEAHQRVPEGLAHALPDFGITDSAKQDVAAIFLESAQYAGVLDPTGAFLRRPSPHGPLEVVDEELEDTQRATLGRRIATPELPPQRLEFTLTEGKQVRIEVPQNLNERDLDLLRSMIGFLEEQIQANRPAAAVVPWPSRVDTRGPR